VAASTVSYVLSGKRPVSAATRSRVERSIDRHRGDHHRPPVRLRRTAAHQRHRPYEGSHAAAAATITRILADRPGTTGLIVQNGPG
jgi:hypothetical protein